MDVHQTLGHIIHKEPPQRSELANIAMDEISSGLKKLSALGYPYKIVPGDGPQGAEFPKALYKAGDESLIVDTAEEEHAARNKGWDTHPGLKALQEHTGEAERKAEDKAANERAKAAEARVQEDLHRVANDEKSPAAEGDKQKVQPAGGVTVVKAAAKDGANISPGAS